MSTYHNITGSTGVTVTLVSAATEIDPIKNILLTNIHSSADATVSLWLQKNVAGSSTETYYIIKNVTIPVGASLLLDNPDMLNFDNSDNGFSLLTTVGSSDTVDIIINT